MCRLFNGRITVSAGFCLLAAWFAAVNGVELLGIVLRAVLLHELGHCMALIGFGVKINRIQLSVFGAQLEANCTQLTYVRELLCVLAGPAGNLFCAAVLAAYGGREVEVGANLVLCAFNLLPVRPLDGGRAVYLAASWLAGPAAGETVTRWVAMLISSAVGIGIVLVVVRSGGSLWLLSPAIGFFLAFSREAAGKGDFL